MICQFHTSNLSREGYFDDKQIIEWYLDSYGELDIGDRFIPRANLPLVLERNYPSHRAIPKPLLCQPAPAAVYILVSCLSNAAPMQVILSKPNIAQLNLAKILLRSNKKSNLHSHRTASHKVGLDVNGDRTLDEYNYLIKILGIVA